MDCRVSLEGALSDAVIEIGGSKSETNRLLLLQALYPEITIANQSGSDDSIAMRNALLSKEAVVDVGHAGTAMRFLTAYFSVMANTPLTLTGSQRMQERPIGILVDALRSIGADIKYSGKKGFPPLLINGKKLGDNVSIEAGISSQYISALMLIAPKLENGLQIGLNGETTSEPYIRMTASLLKKAGVLCDVGPDAISVAYAERLPAQQIQVEADWSSASYFFGIAALCPIGTLIRLKGFAENSVQGDRAVMDIYKLFGVGSAINNGVLEILKESEAEKTVEIDLSNTPDLAQTVAVTSFALGVAARLNGLHTLRIKETDRIAAIQSELSKLGADVQVDGDEIFIRPRATLNTDATIETFGDHRMAMAFSQLAVLFPVRIAEKEVVSKSYPDFWDHITKLGFTVTDL